MHYSSTFFNSKKHSSTNFFGAPRCSNSSTSKFRFRASKTSVFFLGNTLKLNHTISFFQILKINDRNQLHISEKLIYLRSTSLYTYKDVHFFDDLIYFTVHECMPYTGIGRCACFRKL